MRLSRHAILTLTFMVSMALAARGEDSPAARELVDKAIRAQGAEALLAKFPAVTARMKGTFYGLGAAIEFTGEMLTQGADQQKVVIDTEVGGQKLRVSHIVNRDKAWIQYNDQTMELEGEDLAEAKEQAYSEWVSTLVPLKDQAFTLAIVGEASIDNRPAMGITASSKDHRDVNLYFDKETGLLVKTETRVKDETTAQEVTEETFLSEYKEAQGMKQPMKFVVKRDGKLYVEGEISDYQLTEKLDDGVFGKP
jgi:hypothetical protein